MTERERLIEILMKWFWEDGTGHIVNYFTVNEAESIADYLLANGVKVRQCNVGDTVYWYDMGGKLVEAEVVKSSFTARAKGKFEYDCLFADIGKTVFLTKEEAEQALKGGAE